MTDDILDHSRRKFFLFGAAALFASVTPTHAMAQSVSNKLKIGVIGSGHIGGTIGGLWVKAGHSVLFSSRHPEELKPLIDSLGPLAKAGTVADALDFGDVILVAVPYKAIPELAKDYGPKFAGKIVIDPANAVARRDGEDLLNETKEKGIGATTESYLKGSHVVRAFNSMSYTHFVQRSAPCGRSDGYTNRGRRRARGPGRLAAGARCRFRAGGGAPCPGAGVRAGRTPLRPAAHRQGIARALRSRQMTEFDAGAAPASNNPFHRLLRRLINVTPAEVPALGWCWLYIFSVLASYYILRPIRDQMGVAGGVNNLPWLFTGTLIAMLVLNVPFSALVKFLPRKQFISLSYRFFAAVHPGVRRGAALGHAGASGMDRSILLYLDLGVQSFRRVDLLVDGGRYLQLRARQAAVRFHRGRRNPRCDRRGERDGFSGSAGAAAPFCLSAPPFCLRYRPFACGDCLGSRKR